jgi:hypothetical protein
LLQTYALGFTQRYPRQAGPQVQSTLAKLSLCRTAALGGRTWQCDSCEQQCVVYNSCGDRHCPRCGGAKRADWLDKTAKLLLPDVNYFQVVFTLPDTLSSLVLGHRRAVYALLMRAAWRALKDVLEAQGIAGAAQLMLHTWNQELDHHPHVHALVPGGGPALDGTQWITTGHPQQRRRTRPYLTDNRLLGEKFRAHFCAGLKRLHHQGVIVFDPPVLPSREGSPADEPDFAEWLDRIAEPAWNVFIEPPPEHSEPQRMVKYLARYMTGGPLADSRLIAHADGQVTFWARSKNKRDGNQPREFSLPGVEFVRRWSLHILPKGFTKTRAYGGFSGRHRRDYLQLCRQLLQLAEPEPSATRPVGDELAETPRKCPRCDGQLVCVAATRRPSWRDLFREHATCPVWYQPSISFPRVTSSRIRIRGPDPNPAAATCNA